MHIALVKITTPATLVDEESFKAYGPFESFDEANTWIDGAIEQVNPVSIRFYFEAIEVEAPKDMS